MPVRYAFTVNGQVVTNTAQSKADCIEARAPGVCGKLAAQRPGAIGGKNLWTPVTKPVTIEGPIRIAVINADTKKEIDGTDVLIPETTNVMTDLGRRARAPILYQLQEKRLGSIANPMPYVVQDGDKVLRLVMDNDKLVDIEYQIGAPAEEDWEITRFTCNSRDIDHVTGLLAAVGERIEMMRETEDPQLPSYEADYDTIHAHLDKMHEGNVEPTARVNAAIHRCTQGQFQQIGLNPRAFKRKLELKSQRNQAPAADAIDAASSTQATLLAEFVKWTRKADSAIGGGRGGKEEVANAVYAHQLYKNNDYNTELKAFTDADVIFQRFDTGKLGQLGRWFGKKRRQGAERTKQRKLDKQRLQTTKQEKPRDDWTGRYKATASRGEEAFEMSN